MVGAVSPPERCSRSERSPDAELPGRCPKFYPAPPGVEPGGGRDRSGLGKGPGNGHGPCPGGTAPAPAGGPGLCPRVSVLYHGSQPLFPDPAPGIPTRRALISGSARRGRLSPCRGPGSAPGRAGTTFPPRTVGRGQTGHLCPSACPVGRSVGGQGTDGLSSPSEPSVKAAAAARGDSLMSNNKAGPFPGVPSARPRLPNKDKT